MTPTDCSISHLIRTGRQCAQSDDEQNIEHGAADDRAGAHVAAGHEHGCNERDPPREFRSQPMSDVNNSGALLPAAMNVAPATSSLKLQICKKSESELWCLSCDVAENYGVGVSAVSK